MFVRIFFLIFLLANFTEFLTTNEMASVNLWMETKRNEMQNNKSNKMNCRQWQQNQFKCRFYALHCIASLMLLYLQTYHLHRTEQLGWTWILHTKKPTKRDWDWDGDRKRSERASEKDEDIENLFLFHTHSYNTSFDVFAYFWHIAVAIVGFSASRSVSRHSLGTVCCSEYHDMMVMTA